MAPFRRALVTLEKVNLGVIVTAFLMTIAGSMVGGFLYTWTSSLILIAIFVVIVLLSYFTVRYLGNRYLR